MTAASSPVRPAGPKSPSADKFAPSAVIVGTRVLRATPFGPVKAEVPEVIHTPSKPPLPTGEEVRPLAVIAVIPKPLKIGIPRSA